MQTLQINKDTAFKLYPGGSTEFKTILEETFGKEFFTQKITDRVKTFQDACDVVGVLPDNVKTLLAYNGIDSDMRASVAHMKLQIIARALNEGWKPDWTKSSQYKYYPWFDFSSGSGLSFGVFVCHYSRSHVGSRLCFKSAELAKYAGQQFIDLYKEFMCI